MNTESGMEREDELRRGPPSVLIREKHLSNGFNWVYVSGN
jgi:hypothetical protein